MKKYNYKKLLIIWIAVGVAVSGYFYIYPIKTRIIPHSDIERLHEENFGPSYSNGKHSQLAILITLVGSILIGGLGYFNQQNSSTTANRL